MPKWKTDPNKIGSNPIDTARGVMLLTELLHQMVESTEDSYEGEHPALILGIDPHVLNAWGKSQIQKLVNLDDLEDASEQEVWLLFSGLLLMGITIGVKYAVNNLDRFDEIKPNVNWEENR